MKAEAQKLIDFLRKAPQFVIPIYQRPYSWTESECRQLWDDILRAGNNKNIPAHFIGSIVYIEEGPSHSSPSLVIDGQQRLATMLLIMEALARQIGDKEIIEGFSEKKIRHRYLLDPEENDERRYKLLLTKTDKETLLAILDRRQLPDDFSMRLKENFRFFEKQVKTLGNNLEPLCNGLIKLMVVDVALERGKDNPQLIFESMNSTGLDLSQADLIRNFILMDLERHDQERLYKEYWRPMELAFGQEAYGKHFDRFMRHYLTVKTNDIPKIQKVYEAFKVYARSQKVAEEGIDSLVADVHTFAGYYCSMALSKETGSDRLADAFADLCKLKVDVAYPLLLELYHDYANNQLSEKDMEQAVRLIESYVFRRSICSIPTNSLNKTFATFGKALKKDRYMESIQARFMLLPSYRRFPDDDKFCKEIKVRDLYNFRNRSYLLRRLENHGCKERVPVDEYTIEHIMPQNKNLSKEWQADLGDDWQRVHNDWLHTLGNLTLTGYNAEYSDHSFAQKRDMPGGFKESPIRINEWLRKQSTWNEETIQERANRLAEKAVDVWRAPSLSAEMLENYRAKVEKRPKKYTIKNYRHLVDGSSALTLFELFRKEVCALDPCVTEEFLKHYIAYKAETNFVDVKPQSKRLKLSLNIQIRELDDPRNLAQDVSNHSSWGNGDVEVNLNNLLELPYVMGLVRQAFEQQMDEELNQE